MALITKRIYRIADNHSSLNPAQIGVETTPDGDLGYPMYGGKDSFGSITKWLAKGHAGLLTTLKLTGGTTTGNTGLLRHNTDGSIVGGQLTVSQFNNFISDGGIQWTRDVPNTTLRPLTVTDKIRVGDGSATVPGVAFASNNASGVFYGNIKTGVEGVGIAHGGVQMFGAGVDGGVPTLEVAPDFGTCKIEHAVATNAVMSIENLGTSAGDEAHLTIKSLGGGTSPSTITLDTYTANINSYQEVNITTTLQEITLQAQGGYPPSLGGIIAEASYFEFQNYSAYSPIPVWNSGTQWAAYESTFGTEYPILQALVDLSGGGGGAHNSLTGLQGGNGTDEYYHLDAADYVDLTTNLPIGNERIVFGNSSGELGHHANLLWDYLNDGMTIINNQNQTNWYDSNAYALTMTGTATQGMVISSDKDLTLGAYLATGATSLSVISQTANTGSTANIAIESITTTGTATTKLSAQSAGGTNYTDLKVTFSSIAFTSTAGTGSLTWNTSAEILQLVNNVNATNWYDVTAPIINITGTATQGMVIKSDKVLYLATRNTTAATAAGMNIVCHNTVSAASDLYIQSLTTGDGNDASTFLESEGQGDADAKVYIHARTNDGTSPGDDAYIEIKTLPQTGQTGYIDIVGDDVDIAAVRNADYKAQYSITVTTNAFEVNQNNGSWQKVTITANSTWGIRAPSSNLTKTTLEIYNSGGSDYTLTITDASMKDSTGSTSACKVRWVDSLSDGFTIPAGQMVICTILYKGETSGDPEWVIAANETTSDSFGE